MVTLRTNVLLATLLVAPFCAARAETPARPWRIIDLGVKTVFPLMSSSTVFDLNNRGQVLGRENGNAILWQDRRWALHRFPTEASDFEPAGLNDRGDMIGTSVDRFVANGLETRPVHHAAFWRNGHLEDLGILPGEGTNRVRRSFRPFLNNKGQATGTADRPDGPVTAFFWSDGEMRDILDSAHAGVGWAINDAGHVAGQMSLQGDSRQRAFLWRDGRLLDLGTLGGPDSRAYALNERDQVVGTSDTKTARNQAFLWQDGKTTMLERLAGFTSCQANDINERGVIAGTCRRSRLKEGGQQNDEGRATLWKDGRVVDLNTYLPPGAGWTLTGANRVNAAGWILGTGILDGKPHAFVMIPTEATTPKESRP